MSKTKLKKVEKNKPGFLGFRVSEETEADLEELAKKLGVPKSRIARMGVEWAIDELKKQEG